MRHGASDPAEAAVVAAFARLRDADNWTPSGQPASVLASSSSHPLPSRRRRGFVVTVVVAVLLAAVAVTALQLGAARRAVGPAAPAPTRGSDTAGTVGALPRLDGRLLGTWSSTTSAPAGPFDARGDAILVAITCAGGGTVAVSVTHLLDTSFDCASAQVDEPFGATDDRTGLGVPETRPVRVRVGGTGAVRYAVQLWAVPLDAVPAPAPSGPWTVTSTAADVPATLRTCIAADFVTDGAFTPFSQSRGGFVAVRSAGASDCAVRRWPALRLLDSSGRLVATSVEQIVDSAVGRVDAAGRFPAARLTAGGRLFVEVTLPTAATVARIETATDGACGERRVETMQLFLAATGRPVRVDLPPGSPRATCTAANQHLVDVGPAAVTRPAGS